MDADGQNVEGAALFRESPSLDSRFKPMNRPIAKILLACIAGLLCTQSAFAQRQMELNSLKGG